MEKISVSLRVRPLSQYEINQGDLPCWELDGNKIQICKGVLKELMSQRKIPQNLTYEFNNCYDGDCNNYEIFQQSVKDVVIQAIEGINGTVFMYGQTGSGKTFTMLGSRSMFCKDVQAFVRESFQQGQFNEIGILVYAMMEIFKQINKDDKRQYEVKCSYYEIYNENVYDLLKEEQEVSESLIFGTDYRKEFIIKNLKELNVTTLDEVFKILSKGEKNRHYAETILNHQSSRSHTIFKVLVSAFNQDDDNDGRCSTEACINFIDLAGSEKISHISPQEDLMRFTKDEQKVKQARDRNKESQSINKSLFFLTRVIALKTQKVPPQHIPYRNSTLTKLIKSSLQGNFKTQIILSINPGLSQYDQTQSTLRFGLSAKLVEQKYDHNYLVDQTQPNSQKINQLLNKNKSLQQQIEDQQSQIDDLKSQLLSQSCVQLGSPLNQSQNLQSQREVQNRMKYNEAPEHRYTPLSQFSETEASQMSDQKNYFIQLQLEQEKSQSLERNCQDMHKRLLKSNEQILTYFNQHVILQEQVKELQEQNEKLQKLSQQALNRLDCYESITKVSKMSDEELSELQKILENNLQKIKNEQNARQPGFFPNGQYQDRVITYNNGMSSERSNPTSSKKRINKFETEEYQKFSLSRDNTERLPKKSPMKESKTKAVILPKQQQTSYYIKPSPTPSQLNKIGANSTRNDKAKSTFQKSPFKKQPSYIKETKHEDQCNTYKITKEFEYRSRSNEQKQNEQEKLESDISTLATRLHSLSEKFQLRKGVSQNRHTLNKSEIIFETESEAIDSTANLKYKKYQ